MTAQLPFRNLPQTPAISNHEVTKDTKMDRQPYWCLRGNDYLVSDPGTADHHARTANHIHYRMDFALRWEKLMVSCHFGDPDHRDHVFPGLLLTPQQSIRRYTHSRTGQTRAAACRRGRAWHRYIARTQPNISSTGHRPNASPEPVRRSTSPYTPKRDRHPNPATVSPAGRYSQPTQPI
jgi:hypothetical protein